MHKNLSLHYIDSEMLWWVGGKGEELPLEEEILM